MLNVNIVKSVLFAAIGYRYKLKDILNWYGLNCREFKLSYVVTIKVLSNGTGVLSINVLPEVYSLLWMYLYPYLYMTTQRTINIIIYTIITLSDEVLVFFIDDGNCSALDIRWSYKHGKYSVISAANVYGIGEVDSFLNNLKII